MPNLLRNSGFEGGWRTPVAHQQIPDHWYLEASEGEPTAGEWQTVSPEVRVLPRYELPPDEHDLFGVIGEQILKVFKSYGAIHAILSQGVDGLEPGATYELTVPVFVDTYVWDNEKVPPQENDEPNERAARIRFTAGQQSSQWLDEKNVDDWYLNRHELTWRFQATAETMRVEIELWNPWPIDNNGWFLDGLSLESLSEPVRDCVPPREQYERTYILLPQMQPLEAADWRQAAGIGGAIGLKTLGHSADDAGVGPLDRTVLAVNPDAWGEGSALQDFLDTHYPGCSYIPIVASSPTELGVKLLPDLQGDIAVGQSWEEWRDVVFGEDPEGSEIGRYGCLLTGLSIILRKVYQRDVTPPMLDKLLVAARVAYMSGNLIDWFSLDGLFSAFGETVKSNESYSASQLDALQDDGYEIILRRADGQHFVYLESVASNTLTIIDTYDGRRKRKWAGDYRGIRAVKIVGEDNTEPEPEPEPPQDGPQPPETSGPTLSFHVQGGRDGLGEYIANVQPGIVKLCHASGMAREIQQWSPDTLIVYRKVYNAIGDYIYGYDDLQQAASDFIDWMEPELRELESILGDQPFVVEGLNETIATGATEDIRRVVLFESAFARQLVEWFPTARPCVLNTAVGNPQHGAETEMLLLAVRAAIETGGFVGYHSYWPSIGDRSWLENDWKHYAGRWAASWDPVFRAHGLRPHYLLTEGGPIGGEAYWDDNEQKWKPNLNAGAGWRSPECNGGDWNRTLDQILRFDQLAHQSIPGQEGRYGGITLFTVGPWGWKDFQYNRAQFESLANALS